MLTGIEEYLRRLRAKESVAPEDFTPTRGLIVAKEKIAANGDFNLSGERYRGADAAQSSFPYVRIDEVCEVNPEQADPAERYTGYFNYIDISCVDNGSGKFLGANKTDVAEAPSRARRVVQARDVLLSTVRPNLKAFAFITDPPDRAIASTGFALLRAKQDRLLPEFLIQMVRHESAVHQMVGMMGKGAYPSINQTDVESIEIPLPPLEVQKEIVAEIEAYQKVIDGARAVLDHYRPHIPINPDWPMPTLQEVCDKITDGTHRTPNYTDSGVPFLRVTDITQSNGSKKFISAEEHAELIRRCKPESGDVLYSKNGTIGVAKLIDWDWEFSIFVSLALLKPNRDRLDSRYLETFLNSDGALSQATARSKSGTVTNLHLEEINEMKIPLPPLSEQEKIVAEIEAEQRLVEANRQLIERMEQKIAATLARIWGEQTPTPSQTHAADAPTATDPVPESCDA